MGASSAASIRDSLWAATVQEPPIVASAPTGSYDADVGIIGGGYTGCSAALALAEAGARVVLLEAQEIGWGGSGRNGGQVIPGLKLDPSALRQAFGESRGAVLAEQVGSAADLVFGLIDRHGISCSPQRSGWVQAAHAQPALDTVLRRAREWQAAGAPVELLDANELQRRTGTAGYCGGWLDRRAGTLQPLDYVRGLARAAQQAGAVLHARTPVLRLQQDAAGWQLHHASGVVRAGAVILATNAYSGDLVPEVRQSLLTLQSIQVATEPLSQELQQRILPEVGCLSETRRLAFYFRRSPDNRLVFGGRGAIGDLQSNAMFAALAGAMRRIVPAASGLQIAYCWSGQVALTLSGLPLVHEPAPGLFIGCGYNGRGVAMATRMGTWLARRIHAGESVPLPRSDLAPIAWHRLRRPAIAAGVTLAWMRDRLGMAA